MINNNRDSKGRFINGNLPWTTGKHLRLSKKTEFKKGDVPHNYKGGFTNCIDCGEKTHSYVAKRCVKCNTIFRTGKQHNCKHLTPLTKSIRKCSKYKQWVKNCFERDNYTCMVSGIMGSKLVVHHIKYFSKILEENNITTLEEAIACEELWNINNGITLCCNIHKLVHSK